MPDVPKTWRNAPDASTPLSAEALIDLENRLKAYIDDQAIAGAAAGDLSGTWPNLSVVTIDGHAVTALIFEGDVRLTNQRPAADNSVTNASVASGAAIAESKLQLASDAAAGTASRRTLGTGALQAAAGNDARFSDKRPVDYGGALPSVGSVADGYLYFLVGATGGALYQARSGAWVRAITTSASSATDKGDSANIGTSAFQLIASNTARLEFGVSNDDQGQGAVIYVVLGSTAGVTLGDGWRLNPGDGKSWNNYTGAVSVISTLATSPVGWYEI